MIGVLLHLVATTALFYLGSRAVITSWLWSRYPRWLATWADCAACSGTAYGAAVALAAKAAGIWVLPVPWGLPAVLVVAPALGMIGTPLLAYLHQEALFGLGSAVQESSDAEIR